MKLRLVMLCIITPLLLLSAFFAYRLTEIERASLDASVNASERAIEQSLVNDLIHELQKERGYSAGYTASQGANFSVDLRNQRQETDDRLRPALERSQEIASLYPTEFARAATALDSLAATRSQIDQFALTVPQLAGYYTSIINDLLLVAYPLGNEQVNVSMENLQASRSLLAAAKEAAGLERAMGSTGLGGGFSAAVYQRYQRLGGSQQALLQEISKRVGSTELVDGLYASPEYQALLAAREQILQGTDTGDFAGLTAARWFQLTTDWINLLRAEELSKAALINQIADQVETERKKSVRETLHLAAVSIAMIGIFAIGSFEWMIHRIKQLTDVVYGFAKGDFSKYVPSIDRKDEISKMARAIYHFKQETLAMRREAEEMKAADEADLNAKHGKVVELVTEGLSALARADITSHFHEPLDGEYDSIRLDFNSASERLRTVLNSIANTISELDTASARMKSSALDLASRTNEQVDTIRDTTSKMSELSSEVEVFGTDIQSASALAGAAREKANRSAELMRDAVAAMNRIRTSSEKIGDIISMIEDISFQTNLLALNAGVEAARAGSAGLGFAVVASEVRALAQRASDATNEIKSLVEESGKQVIDGGALVDRTGDALEEISKEIMNVDDVLGRISSGSQMQIASLRDLSRAMSLINDLASKNTSMADETRSASGDIAQRSGHLADLICDFKLDQGDEVQSRAA